MLFRSKLAYMSKKAYQRRAHAVGYLVYITVPGVVTHKVPYRVDPSFFGEYNFLLHGLHYITASNEFLEWNKEAQVCLLDPLNLKKYHPCHP